MTKKGEGKVKSNVYGRLEHQILHIHRINKWKFGQNWTMAWKIRRFSGQYGRKCSASYKKIQEFLQLVLGSDKWFKRDSQTKRITLRAADWQANPLCLAKRLIRVGETPGKCLGFGVSSLDYYREFLLLYATKRRREEKEEEKMTAFLVICILILLFCSPETAGSIIGAIILVVVWLFSAGIVVVMAILILVALAAAF